MDYSAEIGKKFTFVITMQSKQNATWQGTVKWLEKQEELPFRSALELITMIDATFSKSDAMETTESK